VWHCIEGAHVILRDSHRCLGGRLGIGYWRSRDEPDLPDPREHVDPSWDPRERARVVAYLTAAERVVQWRGLSPCRLCGCWNGSACLGDDAYNWPEGFAHYLEAHDVRPPAEFVAHALARS
jgi:hypothetical protein